MEAARSVRSIRSVGSLQVLYINRCSITSCFDLLFSFLSYTSMKENVFKVNRMCLEKGTCPCISYPFVCLSRGFKMECEKTCCGYLIKSETMTKEGKERSEEGYLLFPVPYHCLPSLARF